MFAMLVLLSIQSGLNLVQLQMGKYHVHAVEKELLKLSALIVTKKALLIMLPKTKISASRKILVVKFIWIIRMPTISSPDTVIPYRSRLL